MPSMKLALFGLAIALACASPANADSVTFTASNSTGLAASATFTVVGGNIVVTLTNTSSADVTVPSQLLTGVFFTISGNSALSPLSAMLGAGSSVLNCNGGCTMPTGGNVGGEWALAVGISGVGGANTFITSSGAGHFAGNANFNGPNLEGPRSVNGMGFGITSEGDVSATANGGVSHNAWIDNQVVFTLSGWTGGNLAGLISNVSFQFGTDLSSPNLPGVLVPGPGPTPAPIPEPASMVLFGTGMLSIGIGGILRRKFSRARA